MSVTPAVSADREIAELRDALRHAATLVSFCAGLRSADDPDHADRLMAEADRMQALVARTGIPAPPASGLRPLAPRPAAP
ncbi:hypothetical protein ACN20G_37235 (plasmid) [Streptomyces sp. BI20]|uniref:hypothetical protein n=1 Tax=Streptomyces sp. BI20 TaxID=3403460 RepID=UPI003C75CD06